MHIHPEYSVTEESLMLVSLWRTHRGGMQGPGPLPFSGGVAEQPAITMEAFRACDRAAARLRAYFKGEEA